MLEKLQTIELHGFEMGKVRIGSCGNSCLGNGHVKLMIGSASLFGDCIGARRWVRATTMYST